VIHCLQKSKEVPFRDQHDQSCLKALEILTASFIFYILTNIDMRLVSLKCRCILSACSCVLQSPSRTKTGLDWIDGAYPTVDDESTRPKEGLCKSRHGGRREHKAIDDDKERKER